MAGDIFERLKAKGSNDADSSIASTAGDSIFDRFKVPAKTLSPPPKNPARSKSIEAGLTRGATDVSDSLDPILQPTVGRALDLPPTEEKRIARRQAYEKEYGDDTLANVGRLGGQVLTTAPFVPAGAVNLAFKSAPVVAALGSGIVNRLGSTMALGAAGGATYGAGINSTNDEGLGSNVAFNAGAGAVAAPVIAGAGRLGKMVIPAMRSLNANTEVVLAARSAGLPPSAIRNTIQTLEDAGLTPQQATAELNRLGSKATIADLDPSLTAEASGLAALGGKPTAILKNRFGARADQANSAATDLVTSRIGPKPDLEAEKKAIVDRATILTGPDYKTAKASSKKLDASSIAAHIDDELINAVGSEAAQLKQAKSYLYKPNGDIKEDAASLHKVRQALDDTLERLPKEGTSQGTATYRAVATIRKLVDAELKSIPEMAAADAKFAQHMDVKKGLQIGYDALTKKTNKDEFIKTFNAASPEMQDTIRKGLHTAMIDVMEQSGQGEASGMQRLLNKKAVNKEIVRAAFGTRGENIIDAVHDEIAQRGTERAITSGSQTAERIAVQKKYGKGDAPHLGDIAFGVGMDALGSSGAATAATVVKRGISNRLIAMSEGKRAQLSEGTADLLSRQGAERDIGMQVVDQVSKIQNRLKIPSTLEKLPLPKVPTLAAPFGGEAYAKIKERQQ